MLGGGVLSSRNRYFSFSTYLRHHLALENPQKSTQAPARLRCLCTPEFPKASEQLSIMSQFLQISANGKRFHDSQSKNSQGSIRRKGLFRSVSRDLVELAVLKKTRQFLKKLATQPLKRRSHPSKGVEIKSDFETDEIRVNDL